MRAVVCMGPRDSLPPIGALRRPDATPDELDGVAWPSAHWYAARYDRDPHHRGEEDYGDIGEDARGVRVRQHPEVLYASEPSLWPIVGRYQRTGQAEVTREDDATLSAYDLAVAGIVAVAHSRHRRPPKKDED